MIKSLLPKKLKLVLRLIGKLLLDVRKGYIFCFAKKRKKAPTYTNKIQLTQTLKSNPAKSHNLQIAMKAIESVTIRPNEIFSFWKIVGKPTKEKGYKESRSIINNSIADSIGGGLCQLSGLVYYLSLIFNLEIIERYNHSMDIYTEETRFTPLGSDATVAYGYKDLRIKNNLKNPIRFFFLIEEEMLSIELHHIDKLKRQEVLFKQKVLNESQIEVDTIIKGTIVDTSIYKRTKN